VLQYKACLESKVWKIIRALIDGIVLSVNAFPGSCVLSLGADPLLVMGAPQDYLDVRCFIDEILVARLLASTQIRALHHVN